MNTWRIPSAISAVLRSFSGLFINAAYVLDNMATAVNDSGGERSSAASILAEIRRWNQIQGAAARMRKPLIRHAVKPDVVFVHCMDSRFNARETLGGRFGSCYDIGTPGGIMPEAIIEGIKAVVLERGVKVVIFSEHRDCLAKRVVKAEGGQYPALRMELVELEDRRAQFIADPRISELIAAGKLEVVTAIQETKGQQLLFLNQNRMNRAA